MITRRGFLSLLMAAPFAAPAIAKAAVAERYSGVVGQLSLKSFSIVAAPFKTGHVSSFDIDSDVAWGIKRISPADLVMCADAPMPARVSHIIDDPHDPVPADFC